MKQKFIAEFLGTAFLLAVVVGSGIMGENLAQGNQAVTLLANSIATGAGLFVLIQCLGSISGAHFNPIVSLLEFLWGRLRLRELAGCWIAQVTGAIVGVWTTHAMFGQTILQISTKTRLGPNLWFSEVVATFGLICTIALAGRKHVEFAPLSIAAYVTTAYWFTSSTAFANPAVTIARSLSNTFTGIAPSSVGYFVVAQVAGAGLAFFVVKSLFNKANL